MGELNVALVNSHRLFLISGRQPSEKRKKKEKKEEKSLCKRGERENQTIPVQCGVKRNGDEFLSFSLSLSHSVCLFLHFLLLFFLFSTTNIHTKEEGRKSKTVILVKSVREREREREREKRGQKYQEEDEEEASRNGRYDAIQPSCNQKRDAPIGPTLSPFSTSSSSPSTHHTLRLSVTIFSLLVLLLT